MRRRSFLAAAAGAVVSAAAPLPRAVWAQQQKAVVGVFSVGSPSFWWAESAAFRGALADAGYVKGRNLTIEYRWADHNYSQLPAFAADLVGRKVDLIAAFDRPAAHAAKNATSTIPIVFAQGTDPVKDGLVASLARPGGNMTGISLLTHLEAKRIELLSELVPKAKAIALLTGLTEFSVERVVNDVRDAAQVRGLRFEEFRASSPNEIEAAFVAMSQRQVDALIVGGDFYTTTPPEEIVAAAARHAVPAIYPSREFSSAGGLISYDVDMLAAYRQLGIYAGKILKGEKPADLPVQQSIKFELVINLKTAKALNLTVPPSLLARADEVIE